MTNHYHVIMFIRLAIDLVMLSIIATEKFKIVSFTRSQNCSSASLFNCFFTIRKKLITMKSSKCRLSQYCRKCKSIYDESIIYLSQISFHFN